MPDDRLAADGRVCADRGCDLIERADAAMHELPEILVAHGDWLCAEVSTCTCDGPHDTYGHRPVCGLEPLAQMPEDFARALAASRALVPDMAAEITRLRAQLHSVRALTQASDDGSEYTHVEGCAGQPDCPACWAANITWALNEPVAHGDPRSASAPHPAPTTERGDR